MYNKNPIAIKIVLILLGFITINCQALTITMVDPTFNHGLKIYNMNVEEIYSGYFYKNGNLKYALPLTFNLPAGKYKVSISQDFYNILNKKEINSECVIFYENKNFHYTREC